MGPTRHMYTDRVPGLVPRGLEDLNGTMEQRTLPSQGPAGPYITDELMSFPDGVRRNRRGSCGPKGVT